MLNESLVNGDDEADMTTANLNELDTAITRAVIAELELDGVDELDETIYEALNPDALNDLFRDDRWAQVAFEFNGCQVTVDSDGEISVTQ